MICHCCHFWRKRTSQLTLPWCVYSFEFQKTIRTCSSYMTHTAAGIAYCIANLCAWRTCTWTPTTCFASCHPLSHQITHTPICKFQRVATGSFQKKTQNKNKVLKAKQPTPKRAWSNVHLYQDALILGIHHGCTLSPLVEKHGPATSFYSCHFKLKGLRIFWLSSSSMAHTLSPSPCEKSHKPAPMLLQPGKTNMCFSEANSENTGF